jgi:undecaprenyl-diphosphatase
MGTVSDWDGFVLLWINQTAGRNGVVDKLIYDIADAQLLKGGVFLAVYWWLWFDRKGQGRRNVVVAMVAAIVTAILSRLLQVGLPFHQRPLHSPALASMCPLPSIPRR